MYAAAFSLQTVQCVVLHRTEFPPELCLMLHSLHTNGNPTFVFPSGLDHIFTDVQSDKSAQRINTRLEEPDGRDDAYR